MPNTNKPAVQGSENILDKLKFEVANEVGIPNYDSIDKGNLTARENGKIGGNMTKKLVQYAEEHLKG
jgi:hypothetical protein